RPHGRVAFDDPTAAAELVSCICIDEPPTGAIANHVPGELASVRQSQVRPDPLEVRNGAAEPLPILHTLTDEVPNRLLADAERAGHVEPRPLEVACLDTAVVNARRSIAEHDTRFLLPNRELDLESIAAGGDGCAVPAAEVLR